MGVRATVPNDSVTTLAPASGLPSLLWRLLSREKGQLIASLGLLALWQLSEAAVPLVTGRFIDDALARGSVPAAFEWAGVMAAVFVSLICTYRVGDGIAFGLYQRHGHALRVEIARHALNPRGLRTRMLPGEVLALASGDADAVANVVRSVGHVFSAFLTVVVVAYVLLRIDLPLGASVLVGVPLVLGILQTLAPRISRRSDVRQATIAAATATAADFLNGVRPLKGIGAEDDAIDRYRRRSREAMTASILTARATGAMTGAALGLNGVFLSLIAAFAGKRALDGSISVGDFVAVVGITQFLAVPVSAVAQMGSQFAGARASARRILRFLETPPLVDVGRRDAAPQAATQIEFADVTTETLVNFSLASCGGEWVGLVFQDAREANGLIAVLTGETPVGGGQGAVRLSGADLRDLSLAARHAQLLVNPRRPDLWSGTLGNNLDPAEQLDEKALNSLVRAAAIEDVVGSNDDALDQSVAAGGADFSGGERQRIALARALARRPPVLVLHDPTSSVDAVTEKRIATGIKTFRHGDGMTYVTWIVTSSPALLAEADRVLLVRAGRIVREGRHQDLQLFEDYQELVRR